MYGQRGADCNPFLGASQQQSADKGNGDKVKQKKKQKPQ